MMAYPDAGGGIMFSTTLRLADELAVFLQEAARARSQSVNAYLTCILEERRAEERRRKLAMDWTAYAADASAQDVDYAVEAQAEIVAEPQVPFEAAPGPRRAGRKP
jgi:hypothetical protein